MVLCSMDGFSYGLRGDGKKKDINHRARVYNIFLRLVQEYT